MPASAISPVFVRDRRRFAKLFANGVHLSAEYSLLFLRAVSTSWIRFRTCRLAGRSPKLDRQLESLDNIECLEAAVS
jgi:hypothetical protein